MGLEKSHTVHLHWKQGNYHFLSVCDVEILKCKYYFRNKSLKRRSEKVWNVILRTREGSILAFLDTTNVLRTSVSSLTSSGKCMLLIIRKACTDSSLCISSEKSHLPKRRASFLMKNQMSLCVRVRGPESLLIWSDTTSNPTPRTQEPSSYQRFVFSHHCLEHTRAYFAYCTF